MTSNWIDLDDLAYELDVGLDDGWARVNGTGCLRKSLRGKHWAQVERSALGWDWTIYRADPTTMCPYSPASGTDISLRAVKDDVDHWNDTYHRHAVVVRRRLWHNGLRWWPYCRVHDAWGGDMTEIDLSAACDRAVGFHRDCEVAWQEGER